MTKLTRVEHSLQCNHAGDNQCVNQGAGHAMSAIQQRVVAATPSRWRDGIVRSVTRDGWIAVDLLEAARINRAQIDRAQVDRARIDRAQIDESQTVWLWHHADMTALNITGQPVAVHDKYSALAIGAERFSVLAVVPIEL